MRAKQTKPIGHHATSQHVRTWFAPLEGLRPHDPVSEALGVHYTVHQNSNIYLANAGSLSTPVLYVRFRFRR